METPIQNPKSKIQNDLTPLDPWIAEKIGVNQLIRADLERYQLARLRETLEYVRGHSPFYRRLLVEAPPELASLADLARLPFTTPQDVRDNPLRFFCVSQDEIHRIVTLDSSGTTGAPKRIAFTHDDQELTLDFFHVGMSTFTSAGDSVLILLPGNRPGSVGDLLATALQRLGARGIACGLVTDAQETLAVIRQEQVDVVVGTPTQVLLLARHPAGAGVRLKSVLLTTDHVPRAIVAAVEGAWGCVVYNHYGMTEMGLGGGVDCRARCGYHLREADLLFEVVDPATGQAVADGAIGEVVFTTLTRRGMPLIRYRTGDLSRFLPGACPCGTGLKTLEHVRRRLSGIVAIGDAGLIAMADLDEALFPINGLLDFSVTLAQNERVDLQIEALVVPDVASTSADAVDAALDSIPALRRARQASRLSTAVTIKPLGATIIPRAAKRTMTHAD